jgi:APA family basic amino acid/polyamine antiporter
MAFVVVTFLHLDVAVTGVGWLSLGVIVYILYRRRQGLDLTSTHKVAIAQPVVDHEAEYDSVLVPMASDLYDESVVATAAKLANRRRRGIHVLVLITVPSRLAISSPMPAEEEAAQSIIEQARVQAGARVSGHVERVRSGQAGRRIVEEAVDMRAAAIVMPLPRRVNGASLFGKTLETVLAERPCRVIIESAPAPERARAKALERAAVA